MSTNRRWSDDELCELRRLYGTMSVRKVALTLGRRQSAVYRMAHEIGITRSRHPTHHQSEHALCNAYTITSTGAVELHWKAPS